MRVFTCTPVNFEGDAGFFSRDSGLFSEGLRAVGCESMSIMPGPSRPDDMTEHLIRTTSKNLHRPDWWKSLHLDGLVFYSWASPAYIGIAEAVAAAKIPCLVVMDTSGVISPLACPLDWRKEAFNRRLREGTSLARRLRNLAAMFIENQTLRTARRRIRHYKAATAIAAVTPHAALWVRNEIEALCPEPDLLQRVHYLPHPQLPLYDYPGTQKEKLLLSVARWTKPDWAQKQPRVLLGAINIFLKRREDWSCTIIGKGATNLTRYLPGVIDSVLEKRIHFIDYVTPSELAGFYQRASMAAWSSRWEGQQGTAAQALCCGCSVVAPFSAEMSCFRHYVSRESGRLAAHHHPLALAEELLLEADAWDCNQREPFRIAKIWQEEFHAPRVAARALNLLGIDPPAFQEYGE